MTEVVTSARDTDIPVVFTRHLYRAGRTDEGRNLAARTGIDHVGGLLAGSWDASVVNELGWSEADLTIDKVRFDAFLWTSLEPLLTGLGVDHLYVAGVVTNLCVESTIRSAYMRDFRISVIADACAATSARLHEMSIAVLRECDLATIATAVETTSRLRQCNEVFPSI